MECNKSTIYIYPQFKRQYLLQTIENSNLLTNFTTDFTNLSLKLKLIQAVIMSHFFFVSFSFQFLLVIITFSNSFSVYKQVRGH